MEPQSWRKVVQKQVYDIISHRYGLLVILVGAVLIVVSAFHFGESVVEWSTEKYAAVFNSFSDNLAGKSYRERLCLPVPIDVVYTWVNGTDLELIMDLKRLKMEMEDQLNITREHKKCVFSNCIPTNTIVLEPELPVNMSLAQLGAIYAPFLSAQKVFRVTSPIDKKNLTAVVFDEETPLLQVINKTFIIDYKNTSVTRCHITSDGEVMNGLGLKDQIIMSGFPHTLTSEELRTKIPKKLQNGIDKIDMYTDRGIAVLHVPAKEDFDLLLASANFTIEGKMPTLNPAHLVWDLRDFSRDGDISASRFEDNEELRYSLRSLERFAPWVRHIYIITNGQIPYWLNLEFSRVTIVTHEEIFANKSHLPTFGSPAIESNIHRIPGLSDKFIYMNDDVMFGEEVWPDDFFTHSSGQKVYLTWPVPNCNEGCPSSWLKDGYCDKACNVSECEWDAGDCDGVSAQQHQLGGWAGAGLPGDIGYCNTGCANNWIADRYCDTACNVLECAYDAGDCGTEKLTELHQMMLFPNQSTYFLPAGLFHGYFNLSTLLREKDSSIKSAIYDDNKVIRTIAIARKFNVMTVLLYKNSNKTHFNFTLEYGKENSTSELNFTLVVSTVPLKTVPSVNVTETKVANITAKTNVTAANKTEEEKIEFTDIPEDLMGPSILTAEQDQQTVVSRMPSNLSLVPLPKNLKMVYDTLQQELKDGLLAEAGYNNRLTQLWLEYQDFLKQNQSSQENQRLNLAQNPRKGRHISMPKDENTGNEAGEKGQGRGSENDAKVVGRKLLNIVEDRVDTHGDESIHDSFIADVDIQPESGKLLPWEQGIIRKLQEEKDKKETQLRYQVLEHQGRRLQDTFADSLHHVNKLYNKAFGYSARKVPGHMPHMIDKNIMTELQSRFPEEWAITSSHKVRHSKDMQFAFSYFYYLMGVKENVTTANVFDDMDTDKSKILSDREIRTLATRLFDLPLDLQTLTNIEFTFVNCSKNLPPALTAQPDAAMTETYYESKMPQVTRNLFIHCPAVQEMVKKKFPPQNKYKHVTMDDSNIAFKMIKTNVSTVVGQLDDVRKHPKKFICLNDNIDHTEEQAKTVKAILQDFYESVFPIQSQFELPREYRNRFTHIHELRDWKKYRDWLKFWTHIALVLLVIFTVASYFADKSKILNDKQCKPRSEGSLSSPLIWVYTVCKGPIYLFLAFKGLNEKLQIEAAQRRFSRRRVSNESHDNPCTTKGGISQTV